MKAKEIRAKAREALSGRWGMFIGLNVLYLVATFALSLLNFIPFIGYVLMFLCLVPIEYGYVQNLLKLKRGETDNCTEFFSLGLANFGRSWGVFGYTMLKMLVLFVIYIIGVMLSVTLITLSVLSNNVAITLIATIIAIALIIVLYVWLLTRMLLYTFPIYIAADEPELSTQECVEKSAKIMKGNRWKYICLSLSFIGWNILAMLTVGIGYIWLLPYIGVSTVVFYENINKKEKVEVVEENAEVVAKAEDVEDVIATPEEVVEEKEDIIVENKE